MANRERGEVEFQSLGKTWTLKLGVNAMCEIEDATAKSIAEIGALLGDPKTATIKLLRTVMWGALRDHHDDITVKEVGAIIDGIGMNEAGRLIGDAFAAATPEAKEGAGHPPKATAG
ncbi:hypothetical protein [Mesorhizobium sp. KR1-2]|uniref:hypothetical protein n=1 Tax=Mesorhizobium sp. KR1-2 TaxID=3156609 RepID=UPI0032B496C2